MSAALRFVLLLSVGFALSAAAAAQDTAALAGRAAFPPSPDGLTQALHWTGRAIEAVGIGIIVLGALVSSLYFLWQLLNTGAAPAEIYHAYRANLGRGILLGLEFLIAADIIGTVAVAPTLENLGVLALIVVIRTFLSFALEVEIQGHWPWQHSRITGEVAERLADRPARESRVEGAEWHSVTERSTPALEAPDVARIIEPCRRTTSSDCATGR